MTTNLVVKSWNARADTIHQHMTPPVGISFVDAATGKEIHFEGTHRIQSYRDSPFSPNETGVNKSEGQPTPAADH